MNNSSSAADRFDDSGSASPKRKKVRAKYAPRACVACRRSKLKCSGEIPCRRCRDSDRRCFYSEDQTAAEALQHLSRPTPSQVDSPASNGNGGTRARRILFPRDDSIPHGPSDAVVPASTMEARMARMESILDALAQRNGIPTNIHDLAGSEGPASEGHLSLGDPFAPNLVPVHPHGSSSQDPHRLRSSPTAMAVDGQDTIRTSPDGPAYPFPDPGSYHKYLNMYFTEVGPCFPCIEEASFRAISEKVSWNPEIFSRDFALLPLLYLMFACVDVLGGNVRAAPESFSEPPGWDWYQIADNILRTKWDCELGTLRLVQYHLVKGVYLSYAGKPNIAYTAIGLASRLGFQLGLHRKSRLYLSPHGSFNRQCLFWTLYFTDQRISLSCGRPSSFTGSEWDLDSPSWSPEWDLIRSKPGFESGSTRSAITFLAQMERWGDCAREVWTLLNKGETLSDTIFEASQRILSCAEADTGLDNRDLTKPTTSRLCFLARMHYNNLQLFLCQKLKPSVRYDTETCNLGIKIAIDTIETVRAHIDNEVMRPSPLRFHMAHSLGSAVLTLAAGILRISNGTLHRDPKELRNYYEEGDSMLQYFAMYSEWQPLSSWGQVFVLHHLDYVRQMIEHRGYLSPKQIDEMLEFNHVDFEKKDARLSLPEWADDQEKLGDSDRHDTSDMRPEMLWL